MHVTKVLVSEIFVAHISFPLGKMSLSKSMTSWAVSIFTSVFFCEVRLNDDENILQNIELCEYTSFISLPHCAKI